MIATGNDETEYKEEYFNRFDDPDGKDFKQRFAEAKIIVRAWWGPGSELYIKCPETNQYFDGHVVKEWIKSPHGDSYGCCPRLTIHYYTDTENYCHQSLRTYIARRDCERLTPIPGHVWAVLQGGPYKLQGLGNHEEKTTED